MEKVIQFEDDILRGVGCFSIQLPILKEMILDHENKVRKTKTIHGTLDDHWASFLATKTRRDKNFTLDEILKITNETTFWYSIPNGFFPGMKLHAKIEIVDGPMRD
jgi:hypothetical protein